MSNKYLLEVHIRQSYLEMQKWHTAREKYITYHRGRPLDFQTLESNWASPREDEIMPGKLLPQTQHWTAQTIVPLGDHCLAQDWHYQHGDAHQDYQVRLLNEKLMATRRTSRPGSAWYWRTKLSMTGPWRAATPPSWPERDGDARAARRGQQRQQLGRDLLHLYWVQGGMKPVGIPRDNSGYYSPVLRY